jgi:DNA-binding NarL/FixJ family response regulator
MGLRGIPNGPSFRVSIVDDSPDFCTLVATALQAIPQLQVIGCHDNAQHALDALELSPPDVLIADLRLPGMTGIELIQSLVNKEIADTLGVSEHTIKSQLHSIYQKLRIRGRMDLAERWRAFNAVHPLPDNKPPPG